MSAATSVAEAIRAIEAVLARFPDQRGDQTPPCDAPEADWRNEWDSDHAALADEDRMWRQLP